jgi:acetyl-CoA carboxylase biotin carboxyl carrier protein
MVAGAFRLTTYGFLLYRPGHLLSRLRLSFLELENQEVFMADVLMPMNGKVIGIKVEVGESVSEDDELVVIEAMKMELPVVAPEGGTVKEIKAAVGESYQVGDVLVVLG